MSQIVQNNLRVVMSLPHADSVNAIGQFNNWSTVATPLTQTNEDEWEFQLPLYVKIEQLAFFVITKGELFGRVISHAELFYA